MASRPAKFTYLSWRCKVQHGYLDWLYPLLQANVISDYSYRVQLCIPMLFHSLVAVVLPADLHSTCSELARSSIT